MDAESGINQPLLGDRYSVVKELGHSGFGRTYLAKDLQSADELCVMQELLPKIKDRASVEKAKDIFEQEGRVLFQLSHPQIPEFKGLEDVPFETDKQSGARLFLVQDYIRGKSYQEISADRQRYKNHFTETELIQLLQEMLPVLSDIHSRGIIHRDICAENLLLDQIEGRPVLINFATVKEIAAQVRSRLASSSSAARGLDAEPMRIGKVGYAPQEQLSGGQVDETSDLYGLAATIMALATGEEPETLNNAADGSWSGLELLSPKLGRILSKMLAVNARDRFPSAQAVLAALRQESAPGEAMTGAAAGMAAGGGAAAIASAAESMYSSPAGSIAVENSDILVGAEPVMTMASPGLSPIDITRGADRMDEIPDTYEPSRVQETKVIGQPSWKEALIALGVLMGFVLAALLIAALLQNGENAQRVDSANQTGDGTQVGLGEFSPAETARRAEIDARREQLGISENFFTNLVNQRFYQEYPKLRTAGPNNEEKPVTSAVEDEPLRIRWEHIALDLLRTMEDNFSPSSLAELGSYGESDREEWRSQIGAVSIEARSLYDLVDAKFFTLFPEQSGDDFLAQPMGQLYYALADGEAQMIADGGLRESITFDSGESSQEVTGQLDPGDGRLYTVALSAGQLLRLNLNAPDDSTLISLYPPNPTDERPAIFADSEQATWSGSLSEAGDYEMVVINRSNQPISYDLTVSVDSVTSTPVAPPQAETGEDANADTGGNTRENGSESSTSARAAPNSSREDGSVRFERLENSPNLGISNSDSAGGTSERR